MTLTARVGVPAPVERIEARSQPPRARPLLLHPPLLPVLPTASVVSPVGKLI